MSKDLTAMDALPGQFITTMSGAVFQVIEHDRRGDTYLRTTEDAMTPVGLIPAGSVDSIKSTAPVKAISNHLGS